MSKKPKKGKALPPFVPMTWAVVNSLAFKELPPSAGKALPLFIGKSGFPKKPWGDDFSFTYTEAKVRYGFEKSTFSKIINDLNRTGFIELAGYGGLRGFCKSDNKFRLSERWRAYGTDEFVHRPRYDPDKQDV